MPATGKRVAAKSRRRQRRISPSEADTAQNRNQIYVNFITRPIIYNAL